MRVLRLNLSQLLTILEVVIHDPLYKWSLSPVQAQARRQQQNQQPGALGAGGDYFLAQLKGEGQLAGQAPRHTAGGGSGSSSQDAAQRALLRIQNKLLGYVPESRNRMCHLCDNTLICGLDSYTIMFFIPAMRTLQVRA